MRIGYFGGSFDPVHRGHITLAREIKENANLDCVYLIPAKRSPLKLRQKTTPGPHRAAMLDLAIEGEKGLAVDRRELERNGPSFTVDTMREIKMERPQDELFFLVGMDSLKELPRWHRIEELSNLVTFLVALRPGHDDEILIKELADSPVRFEVLQTSAVDVSSTLIRRELAQGHNTVGLVAPQVGDYIRGERLYQTTY